MTSEPLEASSVQSLLAQGQTLGGFGLLRYSADVRRAAFAELVSMKLEPLVERYPLERAVAAHAAMDARRTQGRVVLVPPTT